ncbi:Outer membrane efflux protein BepC precursor [Serratia fonticola]|uniref:Outer membrane efflux protein BepC n=1 Tax=Serratia fonticola TaxID=47917 RepID=A0A4U9VTP0_SERFO|nr:Outer membrane efflux protein BepC precursor [Serratia fonticola]
MRRFRSGDGPPKLTIVTITKPKRQPSAVIGIDVVAIMKRHLYGMDGARLTLRRAATIGLFLGGLGGLTGQSLAAPQVEFNWQAAPTERSVMTLTLQDAILRAFARNPQIAQASAQINVGKADLALAQSAWFPQIALNSNFGKSSQTDSSGTLNNNASAGVTLNQLLYDFGKTSGSIEEQNNLSDAYRYTLYQTMTEVGQQTLQAYLQVKRYQDLGIAAERNLVSLNRVKEIAELRANAGLSSQSDVLQAQTRIAGMNATLEQYRAQHRSAWRSFSVLTGVVPDKLPDLPQQLLQQKITLKSLPLSKKQCGAQRPGQAGSRYPAHSPGGGPTLADRFRPGRPHPLRERWQRRPILLERSVAAGGAGTDLSGRRGQCQG